MPLIPSTMNPSTSGGSDWTTKLMGKKLTDGASDHASFSKKELPKETRVIEGDGGMMTMDHKPDRLNVHVDKDGTVSKVKFG